MTFVVTEQCIKCKHMDCVEVCPVDCFHEGPNFLVIDPDECIDCTLCEPECPVEAIFSEEELPAGQEPFKALNAELAKTVAGDHREEAGTRRCQAVAGRAGQAEVAGTLSLQPCAECWTLSRADRLSRPAIEGFLLRR